MITDISERDSADIPITWNHLNRAEEEDVPRAAVAWAAAGGFLSQ